VGKTTVLACLGERRLTDLRMPGHATQPCTV
jgi:hypothetical protein